MILSFARTDFPKRNSTFVSKTHAIANFRIQSFRYFSESNPWLITQENVVDTWLCFNTVCDVQWAKSPLLLLKCSENKTAVIFLTKAAVTPQCLQITHSPHDIIFIDFKDPLGRR